MKAILIGMLIGAQVFASTTIICNSIPFSDIDSIKIETNNQEVKVTEKTREGINIYTKSGNTADILDSGVEISSWYGYTRTISVDSKGSVTLEHRDECSGGLSFLSCTKL